jgi:hypothetical protein
VDDDTSLDDTTQEIAALLGGGREAEKPPVDKGEQGEADFASELERALTGESSEATEGGESPKADTHEIPSNLGAIAEKLGVKPEDLYDVEIPMPDDGEAVTLGELKDLATKYKRSESERLEFDNERETSRVQIQKATEEIRELVGLIPAELRTPALLEKVRDKMEVTKQQEAAKLLARVPEWRDRATMANDLKVIEAHAEQFGFSRQELSSVYDSRLLAYIRHNALREEKLARVLEEARAKRKPSNVAKTDSKPSGASKPNQRRGRTADAVGAVSQLLRG